MTDPSDHSVHPNESRRSNVPAVCLLIGVTLFALFVRLYHLDFESLWYDELTQTATYHLPISYLVSEGAGHGQPPLDYAIGAALDRVGLASSDWWVRFPAALFGTISVLLVGIFVMRMAGTRAGVSAALLLAVCPLHVVMSQEARPYTIFVCFALATLLSFGNARRNHTPFTWLIFACCALAMLLTRWVAPNFVMLGLGVYALAAWLLVRRSGCASERHLETQRLWAGFTAATLAYAAYGPFFGVIFERARRGVGASQTAWSTRLVDQLSESFQAILAGHSTETLFRALPTPLWMIAATGVLISVGLIATTRIAARRNADATLLLLVLVPFPLLYAATYAKLAAVQAKPQYLLLMVVPIVALIAVAADRLARHLVGSRDRWQTVCAAAIVAIIVVPMSRSTWTSLANKDKRAWRDIMTFLSDHADSNDTFAVIAADTVPAVYHPVAAGTHRYGLGWAKFVPIEIDTQPSDLDDATWNATTNTVWIVGIKDRLYDGHDQLTTPILSHTNWSVHDAYGLFAVGVTGPEPAIDRLALGLEAVVTPLPHSRGAVAPHLFRGRVLLSRGAINQAHRAFSAAVRQCRNPNEVRTLIEKYVPQTTVSRLTAAAP